MQRARALRYVGLRALARCSTRSARSTCSKQGRPSQANRGPKNRGRSTQLFPSDENDFFRNRLTHSIEVAQIATGIALNLNATSLKDDPIDEHLVHFAALAHDLGHP